MEKLRPLSEGEAFGNCRVKFTPGGEVIEWVVASRPIFKADSYLEPLEKRERGPAGTAGAGDGRGARRARKRLYELARCNDFDTFITLTLSPEEIDRYDYKAVVGKLNDWLDNRVRRKGLRYILVAERHKDGAIHFHGLVNGEALKLVDSGHSDGAGRKIYNVADWRLGFTTAVKVDENYGRVCSYVSKYITKQQSGEAGEAGPVGGRWFYHGGALEEPRVRICNAPAPGPHARRVENPEAALTLWYS